MCRRTPSHQKVVQGISANNLVIGGLSISAIRWAMNGKALRIGRIKPTNAFCIKVENEIKRQFLSDFYYIYTKVAYKGYRKAAAKLLGTNGHIDHVLSRKLASHLGVRYVLTALVKADVNISHGSIERLGLASKEWVKGSLLHLSKVVYMDNRIEAKLHSQKILLHSLPSYKGFDRDTGIHHVGLDLRYGVNMNRSLGFDRQPPESFVKSLTEFQYNAKT